MYCGYKWSKENAIWKLKKYVYKGKKLERV